MHTPAEFVTSSNRKFPNRIHSKNVGVIICRSPAVVAVRSKWGWRRPYAIASAVGYVLRKCVRKHERETLGEPPFHLKLSRVVMVTSSVPVQVDRTEYRIWFGSL